ncbi:MAG: polysaccharide deacetylase family protein [Thermoanaerobaculia bacterium]|nr:polysaccharide deacetylase family protein [Thermoanaerobaculia bacterium]
MGGVASRRLGPAAKRPETGRPYRPSPLIWASVGLHGAALAAALMKPSSLRQTLPLLIADHLALSAAGSWTGGDLLGPNLVRLPAHAHCADELCLTFDDGPDPRSTPEVLDLLDQRSDRATFFCVGRRVARYPDLAKEIVQRGHRIENHTYHHRNTFAFRLWNGLTEEVDRAQEVIAEIVGRRPQYFRPPAGMRNPILEAVLARHDLLLVNWTRRGFDAVVRDPAFVVNRLVGSASAGSILLLHDGALGGGAPPAVDRILPRLLEVLERRGLRSMPIPDGLTPADATSGRSRRVGVDSASSR